VIFGYHTRSELSEVHGGKRALAFIGRAIFLEAHFKVKRDLRESFAKRGKTPEWAIGA